MTVLCHVPVSLPTIAYRPRLPLWYSQLHEALCPSPGFLPLFPDVAPITAAQPAVPFLHRCLHACCPEIIDPAPDVDFYLLHHDPDISALTAGSQFLQFGLGLLQGLCVDSDINALPSLP